MLVLNAIIIDDQKEALDNTKKMIAHFFSDKIKIVECFSSGFEALKQLNNSEFDIDVIFLDIEMPEIDGLEFMHLLPKNKKAKIVILSGKEQYAVHAIKYQVSYYLLKPLSIPEFKKCLEKIYNEIEKEYTSLPIYSKDTVIIKSANITYFLETKSIKRLEARRSDTLIYYKEEILNINKNLKQIEELLPKNLFFKAHRSHVVNLNFIKEISKAKVDQIMTLVDDTKIEISKQKKIDFLSQFKNNI